MGKKVIKKRRRRIRWKTVIPMLIAFILVIYLMVSLFGMLLGGSKQDGFTTCKLSTSKLQKKLSSKQYAGLMEMSDFIFYGEHLSLYSEEYEVGTNDSFVGRTMILKNVCSNKEIKIDKLGDTLDGQIDTRDLPVGLYEVYIVDNLIEKRLYMDVALKTSNAIYTTAGTKVEVLADAALLNKKNAKENALDRNYVFIHVTKEVSPENELDIMLNPGPITINATEGQTGNGVTEEEEMYRLAKKVKDILTKKGFKVGISHEEYNWMSLYGETGTLAAGYQSNAKYFVNLGVYSGGEESKGMQIVHSSYVSNELAASIYDEITSKTSLEGKTQTFDVVSSSRSGVYDSWYEIREAGGRALGTGLYSERSADNAFASNENGMEAIYLDLFNIDNADDVVRWNEEFDQIANAIAEGIVKHLSESK
ncbi:MAG: N-acetylmuramoyl-L-alanine amidase [Erysipelotrichaceae bacterium]|nr:N-acetylmuramoyl-L-alanine amidase [Erysipelotrichaceae bacterium]